MRVTHPIVVSILGLALVLAAPGALPADYGRGLDAAARGDIAGAHDEFLALAREGHSSAQYSLAMLYLKSHPPQYARAIPWLEASAQAGLPDSQYLLGMLALYGVGMPKNTKVGMRWLGLASGQGNAEAEAKLAELEQVRLRAAERERRKAALSRDLEMELEKARQVERALEQRLEKVRQREAKLASEQQSLKNARARDAEAKAKRQREHSRLEGELAELQALVAEAERVREAGRQAPARVDSEPEPAPSPLDGRDGEAIVSGKVVEILPDGVLLTHVTLRTNGRDEAFPEEVVVFLAVIGSDALREGQRIIYPAELAPPYRYRLESGAIGRVRAYRVFAE